MHGLWTSSNQLGSGEQIQRVLNELAEVNSADIEKPRHDDKGAVTCNSIFLYAKCCKKLVAVVEIVAIDIIPSHVFYNNQTELSFILFSVCPIY
ncbi:hypothetical protein GH714_017439 [Hevea brasiliensis]|uniref:Uncharacterized protein n=1 Tax=Hevea brasiliensis TaxID=3981 RepID=A0A6A6N1Q1_HEVBR|nr:hypothetical protein GH714_017005 [Hevea brasiliensis]KAF2319600.1 hypothetical protein GH714_017439 [Hevea brasiliensis]